MNRGFAPPALALCLPLLAALCFPLPAAPLERVQVVTTDRADFAAGGTIRVEGSYGDLNIEGWDQSQIEVVLTRSDYAAATDKDRADLKAKLEKIAFKIEKRPGNEIVVDTQIPHRNYFIRKALGKTDANLEYRIMVPRDSHLIVHHGNGDVVLYDVGGDIEATAGVGSITVQLRDPAQYAIDARNRVGGLYTGDYSGQYHNRFPLGKTFANSTPPPAHKVYLRVRIGPVDVIKMGENPIAK
jgi:hypothetical protein